MTEDYEDYLKDDYRAFVFATHPDHGMLLLHCMRKKKKPPHFQAPGGHVEEADFLRAKAEGGGEGSALLIEACKIGVARELFEETGIDIRSTLDRLQPVRLHRKGCFFKLCLEDSDFFPADLESIDSPSLFPPMNKDPPPLMLKLSHEHQGFMFEPSAVKSVDLLVDHTGGKVSKALKKAIEHEQIKSAESKVGVENESNAGRAKDNSMIVGNPMEGERVDSSGKSRKKLFDCFNCC